MKKQYKVIILVFILIFCVFFCACKKDVQSESFTTENLNMTTTEITTKKVETTKIRTTVQENDTYELLSVHLETITKSINEDYSVTYQVLQYTFLTSSGKVEFREKEFVPDGNYRGYGYSLSFSVGDENKIIQDRHNNLKFIMTKEMYGQIFND